MFGRDSFLERIIMLPFAFGNPFFVTILTIAFFIITTTHIVSFFYKCVWFYKPGINVCQNHRPLPVKKESEPIELKVVKAIPNPVAPTTPAKIEYAIKPAEKQYASAGKISVDSNLRSGPGMGYPIKSVLYEGSEVEILETRDGWHHIKLIQPGLVGEDEATTGWVWSNLITE